MKITNIDHRWEGADSKIWISLEDIDSEKLDDSSIEIYLTCDSSSRVVGCIFEAFRAEDDKRLWKHVMSSTFKKYAMRTLEDLFEDGIDSMIDF